MKYAINLNTVLPVRAEASETSEMTTQLLFGEICQVLTVEKSFARIRNQQDGYSGWVDAKMLTEISENDFQDIQNQPVFRVCVPLAEVFSLSEKSIYRLTGGSILPYYNADTSKFGLKDSLFQIHPSFVTYLPETNKEGIVPIALQFLNTPYLWGGKNIMGMDCSGFVQTIFSMNGYNISRDACTQVKEGKTINFEDAESGDLFFFEKDGKITHVGIYTGEGRIIHASGKVKINEVDKNGILSEDESGYTHILSEIRHL